MTATFVRCDITKGVRVRTPGRVAAAKRAVKKERERAGLFGEELMRFTTPEQRLDQMDTRFVEFAERIRGYTAETWRKNRQKLSKMPAKLRKEVLDYWNSSPVPKRADNLADLIHQLEVDPKYLMRKDGRAHPYTRTVVNRGVITIEEISEEAYSANFEVK